MAGTLHPDLVDLPAVPGMFRQDATGLARDEAAWVEDAAAWIGEYVSVPGPIRRRHVRPWSVVARVGTADGICWFKEVGTALAFEPALTARLAVHVPRFVPVVLGAEGPRLLTLHAGKRLDRARERHTRAPAWEEIVARYAELQIELTAAASDLPAPDCRPETLARRFGRPADRLLAGLGDAIPLSLLHLDVGPKNVCIRNGGPVFIDWAAGALGHPFCGLVKTLRFLVADLGAKPGGPEVLRVRDAYLEPWTTFAPPRELRRIFAAAYPLGALARATTLERRLEPLPEPIRERYAPKADKWLQSFEESLRGTDRLGA